MTNLVFLQASWLFWWYCKLLNHFHGFKGFSSWQLLHVCLQSSLAFTWVHGFLINILTLKVSWMFWWYYKLLDHFQGFAWSLTDFSCFASFLSIYMVWWLLGIFYDFASFLDVLMVFQASWPFSWLCRLLCCLMDFQASCQILWFWQLVGHFHRFTGLMVGLMVSWAFRLFYGLQASWPIL